jgi:hypothetical protein
LIVDSRWKTSCDFSGALALDAALSASREMAGVHLQQAREMERRLRVRLTECNLDEERRHHTVQALDELAARLIAMHRPD